MSLLRMWLSQAEDYPVSLSADVLDNVGCMDIDAETAPSLDYNRCSI